MKEDFDDFKEILDYGYEYIAKEYGPETVAELKQRACDNNYAVYNEMFKIIEEKGGRDEVIVFWLNLAREKMAPLDYLAGTLGLPGCVIFWSQALQKINADAELVYDIRASKFEIRMKSCPAIEQIGTGLYKDYCQHCKIMYGHVLRQLNYKFNCDYNGEGQCLIQIFPLNS